MKALKRFQPKLLAAAVLMGLCTLNSGAFAAGTGSGSGGTGGTTGGQGEVLGDLVVLLRDASGVPILTADKCQQPLAAPGVSLPASADGTIPTCTPTSPTASCTIPVVPATCAVVAGYETYLQAVDFARMSVARSPAKVMDKQLADVLVNLSTAQCLSLDPAGRLVYSTQETTATGDLNGDGDTNDLVSSAVDSPLQNLAIYRELMTKGSLGTPVIKLPTPSGITGYGILDTAAKALGAASDKGGKIDVNLVVYLNQILGLDQTAVTTSLPKIDPPLVIRQEVQGQVVDVTKYFLNYGSYSYNRTETYGNLPYPANIPAPNTTNPQLGYFEYLTPYLNEKTEDGKSLFYINSASIVQAPTSTIKTVFVSLPEVRGSNIGSFAQAADDARAVIEFMHSHPVMAGYETPVKCAGSVTPPLAVDVSSKLQMPTRMVGGTTREGTLTVSNLKGAAASGKVDVTGTYSGGSVSLPSSPYSFSGLAAGQSKSFTISFKAPSAATTITWTATATAEGDNNSTNNTATFKTTVTAARGQGGGGE